VALSDEYTSDLAVHAALQALKMSGFSPADIDLIIVATTTPDNTFPATAVRVQEKLGISRAIAFDLAAACSGFIFACATADAYLTQGLASRALVIGAETLSRLLDWTDRRTAVLFGDGAGAVVLEAVSKKENPERGVLGTVLHTCNIGYDALKVSDGPGSTQKVGTIHMNGPEVFKTAVKALGDVVEEILKKCSVHVEEIDWIVPHQANRRIIDATASRLKFPQEKIVHTTAHHANTSAASIPLALNVAVQDGRIQPGHLVLCEAFGAGFSWGALLIRV
jgi:3-oxoacyl-[acyl-carrier-protein] synthase-3